jgi:hypothetical protein
VEAAATGSVRSPVTHQLWCHARGSWQPVRLVTRRRVADKWGPASIQFSRDFQTSEFLKFKTVTFPMSKIHHIFQEESLKHKEQLSFLAPLQIPSVLQVINSGINSILNIPQILKGFKPFRKNLINSLKFYFLMIYLNIILH